MIEAESLSHKELSYVLINPRRRRGMTL